MNCEEFRRALGDGLEPEVDPVQRAEAAVHAEECAACRALAGAARQLRSDLGLERAVVAKDPASGAIDVDDEDAPARRFDLLLAAWRSGAADAARESSARVPAPVAAPNPWKRVAAASIWLVVGVGLGGFAARCTAPRPVALPPAAEPSAPADDAPRFFIAMLESTASSPAAPVSTPPPKPTPAEIAADAQMAGEYSAWARSLHDRGLLVDADRLSDQSYAYIHMRGGRIVVADEPRDDNSHLGGYFLVRAKDLDAAIELARKSPHFKYGGEIEIRAVVPDKSER